MNEKATQANLDWQGALSETYHQISQQVLAHAPQLLAAVLLFLAGLIIAVLFSRAVSRLLLAANSIVGKLVPASWQVQQNLLKPRHATLLGRITFWLVLLFFAAAGMNVLGFEVFYQWLAEVLAYLPRLIAGLLIILGGYLLGIICKSLAVSAAQSAGFSETRLIGHSVQAITVFTALVIGIEQLGINIHFLTNIVIVVLGISLFGMSLAFGLGARTLVANVIGAQQASRHCQIGSHISLGEVEGILIEIDNSQLVLESSNGRITIPARLYLEQICQISSDGSAPTKASRS